jgi:hypothetical protein
VRSAINSDTRLRGARPAARAELQHAVNARSAAPVSPRRAIRPREACAPTARVRLRRQVPAPRSRWEGVVGPATARPRARAVPLGSCRRPGGGARAAVADRCAAPFPARAAARRSPDVTRAQPGASPLDQRERLAIRSMARGVPPFAARTCAEPRDVAPSRGLERGLLNAGRPGQCPLGAADHVLGVVGLGLMRRAVMRRAEAPASMYSSARRMPSASKRMQRVSARTRPRPPRVAGQPAARRVAPPTRGKSPVSACCPTRVAPAPLGDSAGK